MKKLSILQNQFIDGIYEKENTSLLFSIKDGKAPKTELIDIYRNNLYCNLHNVLRITYPKIYQYLGEEKFKKHAHEFIKQHRSQSGNLDEYGGNFANFFTKKNNQFLHDLAKMQWLEQLSYLAADAPTIVIEELQKMNPEKLFDVKFKLHPSCFLLQSSFNLLAKQKLDQIRKRENYFVIFRHDGEVKTRKIRKDEFAFLSGVSLNKKLFEIFEDHQIDVQFCLTKYLQNGVLSEFSVQNKE